MKKIDLNLLQSIGKPRAIIDGMLDRQIQTLEAKLGSRAGGTGNKLLSLLVKNGFRVQLSKAEIMERMGKVSNLSDLQIDSLLDGMLESGLLRQTLTEQFELANNFIARKAHEKVEAENRVLSTIKTTIQDRMSRNQLLDQTYLNYIAPSLDQLDLKTEERKFVRASEAAVRRSRRLINTVLTVLFLLMAIFAIGAFYNFKRASVALGQQKEAILKLEAEKRKTQEAIAMEIIARKTADSLRIEADSARADAERKTIIALQARDTADQLRYKAIADRDSINSLRKEALSLVDQLQVLKKEAELKAEGEIELRKIAEENKNIADSIRLKEEQLNRVITSRIAANRSLQIEDPHMRSLIALEAYKINKNNAEVGDIHHPSIVKALYAAVEAGEEDFFRIKEILGTVKDIVVSPDGRKFFTAGSDSKVRKWTINEWGPLGKPKVSIKEMNAQAGGVVNTISLSPDGSRLLVGGESGNFQVLNTSNGDLLSTYKLPHSGEKIYQCAFDDEGNFCGLGRDHAYFWFEGILGDVTQKYFNYKRGDNRSPLISLDKVPSKIGMIRKNKDGFIAYSITTAFRDYSYWIYSQKLDGVSKGPEEYLLERNLPENIYGNLTTVAFHQVDEANGYLVYGFSSGRIMILTINELNVSNDPFFFDENNLLKAHQASISAIAFSDNGKYLAVASYDGSVSLWDMSKYKKASYQPILFDGMSSWATTVAFAQNDKTLITGCRDGSLYFWNTNPEDYAHYLCRHLDANQEKFFAQQKEINDVQNKSGVLGVRHNELEKSDYVKYFGALEDPTQRKVKVCEQ